MQTFAGDQKNKTGIDPEAMIDLQIWCTEPPKRIRFMGSISKSITSGEFELLWFELGLWETHNSQDKFRTRATRLRICRTALRLRVCRTASTQTLIYH